ncbi:MAG: clostripain-related cysteine peptidase, partial [Armatimonadota bacterium]
SLVRSLLHAFVALALLASVGCGGSVPKVALPPAAELVVTPGGTKVAQPGWKVSVDPDVQPRKKWTVLVYINGANDLEKYGLLNMNQMEQWGSTEGVNLVVQFKRIKGRFDSTQGDWGDTRRYYVTRETANDPLRQVIESRVLSQRDDVDMGQGTTLREFTQWGVKTFPADHYCLVLWNHGAGWRKVALTRGFSYDDETDNHIDTIQMPEALAHPENRKWDLVMMDLSLMQMVEVAYENRNVTDLLLGSQESPPGEGLPYDLWVQRVVSNPDIGARDLATGTIQDTLLRFGTASNTTQSVLDPTKIADLVAEMDGLGAALLSAAANHGPAIASARSEAESYAYSENKDLIDFVDRLAASSAGSLRIPDPEVQNKVVRVRNAAKAAIVANVNGSRHPRSNGIAAYIPSPAQYDDDDLFQANGFGQRYQALGLAKAAPKWHQFLVAGPP